MESLRYEGGKWVGNDPSGEGTGHKFVPITETQHDSRFFVGSSSITPFYFASMIRQMESQGLSKHQSKSMVMMVFFDFDRSLT